VACEEQRVELVDVVAGFEDEEVEEPDGGRGRHARSMLVSTSIVVASKLFDASRNVHRGAQFPNRSLKTNEHGSRNNMMSDVELLNLGNGGYRAHICRREAMSGMNRKSERHAER
jgi:hypothetical protein